MTIVFWGSIISILGALCGGVLVAYGKFQQDKASSKKSEKILSYTQTSLDVGNVTKEGVEKLVEQRNELRVQVTDLIAGQDSLRKQLEPFIEYSKRMFPGVPTNQALVSLQKEIELQAKKLEETDQKVQTIHENVESEKKRTKVQLELKNWIIQNQKVTSISNGRPFDKNLIDVKEKFGVDFLYFNQMTFSYATEINRSEVFFTINRDNVSTASILKINGATNVAFGKRQDGKFIFKLTQPENGLYDLKVYTTSEISSLEDFIMFK